MKLKTYLTNNSYLEYMKYFKLNNKKTKYPFRKWAEHEMAFYWRAYTMTSKHMEMCSTSLTIKKMKITTTMSYHNMPVRMTIIRNSGLTQDW